MTTFDLSHFQDFVAALDARMGPSLNGSRDDPATLAAALRDHANLCREFTDEVREWRRAIFSGRIEFDLADESVVLAEAGQLVARADDLHPPDSPGDEPGRAPAPIGEFLAAVAPIRKMHENWLRPRLAVGPGPRSWQYMTPEMIEEGRRRIAALPPLPADWLPADPEQRARFLKLRDQ